RSVLGLERLGCAGKRKYIGGVILAAKLTIQFPDGFVRDEHNRRAVVVFPNRLQSFLAKLAPLLRIHFAASLKINDFDPGQHDFAALPPDVRKGSAFPK